MELHSRRQWYFVQVLAILTAATTAMYFWLQAKFDLTAANPGIPPSTAPVALFGTIAVWRPAHRPN